MDYEDFCMAQTKILNKEKLSPKEASEFTDIIARMEAMLDDTTGEWEWRKVVTKESV